MNAGNSRIGTRNAGVHLYAARAYFRTQFAHSAEVRKHSHILAADCYVGPETAEGAGEPSENKVRRLAAQLPKQQQEAARLDAAIAANLKEPGYGG